ncbi:MAG: hypothetical protein KGQ59_06725 [Bdellovibrionales bacterium]|nr:hypothetical protein [Bdellovibrionales bacterium]
MDRRLNSAIDQNSQRESASDLLVNGLPPRNESQFLAQLPDLSASLLHLSQDFEAPLQGLSRTMKLADTMRGWHVLESLARESLLERARLAAQTRVEQERQRSKELAQIERPIVPRRTIESAIKSQAMKALQDPGVLNALKQWTQARNNSRS